MFQRNPWREFIAGARGRPPPFVTALMVLLMVGIVGDSFVELAPALDLFRLSRAVWQEGQMWRLVTYGPLGFGPLSMWSLFEVVLVYWFVMEAVSTTGIRKARVLVGGGIAVAAAAAAAAQALSDVAGGPACAVPFWMMQGQHIVLAIAIPAFAMRNRYSTVSHTPFLFGLPIPTRWLIPLQALAALAAFAATRDFGGFVGIAAATIWSMRVASPRT